VKSVEVDRRKRKENNPLLLRMILIWSFLLSLFFSPNLPPGFEEYVAHES
jgi:hypothetical protein